MDSPIARASLTASVLSGASNAIAQAITCYRSNPSIQATSDVPTMITTFASALRNEFNPIDLFHFMLFSLLACPPNYLWQSWLEGRFPGYTTKLSPTQQEKLVDDVTTGSSTSKDTSNGSLKKRGGEKDGAMTEKSTPTNPVKAAVKAEKKLNLVNTLIKFCLDQTLGAAVNTVLFIAGIALLRGLSFDTIQQNVLEQFWPMIRAGQKLWPIVSVCQFTIVPFEWRTLVGSTVGLFWGVLLSLMASPGKGKIE
ncbi:hypothetical protein LTR17_009236 [Elasticomyces elasticus]|nr:hypothetical protein LTR17_009236 [Elasticomyces elasticus]